MSILLESLSQKANQSESELPNIQSQHFDDELLGDEWLVARIRRWRLIAISALILLVLSWSYFLFAHLIEHQESTMTDSIIIDKNSEPEPNTLGLADKKTINPDSILQQKQTAQPVEQQAKTQPEKQAYRPQKRESNTQSGAAPVDNNRANDLAINRVEKAILTEPNQSESQAKASQSQTRLSQTRLSAAYNLNNKSPILVEELPGNIRDSFPELDIGSYVLSEDPTASFVILDGQFFSPNQVISQDLILREITSEAIILEHKGYLVKLPH